MKKISEILNGDIYNPYTLYTKDLYNLTVAYQIKGVSISKLNGLYKKLPIHSKKDIVINGKDIAKILNKEPEDYLKKIIIDIEKQIINGKILNEKEELEKYILKKYK